MCYGVYGVLGGAIYVASIVDVFSGHAGDVDYVAEAVLFHGVGYELRDVEETLEIGVDHCVPIVVVAILKAVGSEGETGVVDANLEVLFPRVWQHVVRIEHFVLVAYVEAKDEALDTGCALNLATEVLEERESSASDGDVVAQSAKHEGCGPAYAGCRAGYEGGLDMSCLFVHSLLFYRWIGV